MSRIVQHCLVDVCIHFNRSGQRSRLNNKRQMLSIDIWSTFDYKVLKVFFFNDAKLLVEKITLHKLVPPVELATQISRLGSYLSGLSEDFTSTGTPPLGDGSSLDRQAVDWASETPSADGIEKAKRSLKGWLSDLFILDMRERLL
ncbi:hypothetical protein CRG98_042475 [Punica granatum]|uniref:Uncharacterized protein n=1 Tax=Punica granatum TaxID=22663 RepID=A0A2I0I061_PUNGR|nr:hypothetical protein CRG98_042475 [Punica granatum]